MMKLTTNDASDLKTWPATTRFKWVPDGSSPEVAWSFAGIVRRKAIHSPDRSCFLSKGSSRGRPIIRLRN